MGATPATTPRGPAAPGDFPGGRGGGGELAEWRSAGEHFYYDATTSCCQAFTKESITMRNFIFRPGFLRATLVLGVTLALVLALAGTGVALAHESRAVGKYKF